jgi:hypothetical protein
MWLSAGVSAVGVVIALTLVGNRPVDQHDAASRPEAAAAEAVPVAR